MLPLDSAGWATLDQAYGSAEDVPRLLEHLDRVGGAERDALWLGLWATLWRDGHVYSASYAAVPHLVAHTTRQAADERARALHLVATIELARRVATAPPMPDELSDAYSAAIAAIPAAIASCVAESWSHDTTQIMVAVMAIAKGHLRLGAAMLEWE
jgi:hypothetical protein